MIREEKIKRLKALKARCERLIVSSDRGPEEWRKDAEALDLALSALRPVSREQVEKVWSGCPECKPRCGLCVHMEAWDRYGKPCVCEKCVDYSNFESEQRFCEVCGCPMTDEAVDMVMERWKEAVDGETCGR